MEMSLQFTREVRRWRFPEDRFIEYETADEAWAIPLGFGWYETVLQTVNVPRAVVTGVDRNGNLTLQAIPSDGLELRVQMPAIVP